MRVVLLREVLEQDTAVDKSDPRSVVGPCIRIAPRPCLLWAPAKWEPWMVKRDLIGVTKRDVRGGALNKSGLNES